MSEIILTNDVAKNVFSPWWVYLLFGLNLIFLSIFIILFPALLWLLVSTFMMADGLVLLVLAFIVWRAKKKGEKHASGKQGVSIY